MWKFKNKKISSLKQVPKGAYGFVYIITNKVNGKSYIGKKNLFFERKVNLGKKEIALKDKRLKTYKYIVTESDWLTYTGSCKELNDDIKNGHEIEKVILEFCFTKRELTYKEIKYLFKLEVLELPNFYNKNILGRFFDNVLLD